MRLEAEDLGLGEGYMRSGAGDIRLQDGYIRLGAGDMGYGIGRRLYSRLGEGYVLLGFRYGCIRLGAGDPDMGLFKFSFFFNYG